MFENCTVKYITENGVNSGVKVTYPKKEDGSMFSKSVPLVEDNTDYQNILQWVADGNTIEEAD